MADSASAIAGKKVLIIEDDTLLHTLLAGKMTELRNQGVEVFPVINAEEGLKVAKEHTPDLILLDLVMPDKGGFEFLTEIRKEEKLKNVPVIILSNLSQEEDKAKAKELGVVKYIVKADFSLDEISKIVTDILSGAH